jgi:drug/metabolite transporter (DMT)-like permease
MSAFAFLLVLSSSLCWTGIDLVRRLLATRMDAMALLSGLMLGFALPLAAWGFLGAWPHGIPPIKPSYWLPGLASLVINLLGNWLFVRSLALAPYSLVMPLLCLTPVFTTLLAIPVLHELPSTRQLAGVVLIVAGALWLNWPEDARDWLRNKGSLYMLAVALCWALVSPADKLGTQASDPAFHGAFINFLMAGCYAAILVATGRSDRFAALRPNAGLVAIGGLVGAAAIGLQLAVLPMIMVSLFEAVKRMLGLVAAVILGRLLFKEAITARKIAAIATMAGGLILVLF